MRAGGWLSGWSRRVKLTIDQVDIDADLSNFPVLIYLGASSGRGPDDVTFVFDEIQSNSNRKKIAVTTGDGTTECYVEIERWDQASEKAWLWVKVPSVSGTVDTVLYLYYDRTHTDNTAYVGDTDSSVAENVWDSSHKGVWHLSESTGGTGAIKDSTLNNNDGTDSGSPPSVAGMIGNAFDFTPTQYINVGSGSSLDITQYITISAWICPDFDQLGSTNRILIDKRSSTNADSYRVFFRENIDGWRFLIQAGTNLDAAFTWTADTWHYIVATYDGGTMRIFWDGAQKASMSASGSIGSTTYPVLIAA